MGGGFPLLSPGEEEPELEPQKILKPTSTPKNLPFKDLYKV